MSHITKLEIEVRNLRALAACLTQFGATLAVEQKNFREYFGTRACDAAIKVAGAEYEIGLIKQSNGSYDLQADFWRSGGLGEKFGMRGEKLKQAYASQVAKMYWTSKGYRIREARKADGTVVLVAEN